MEAWKTCSFAVMTPVRIFLWLCGFIVGHPLIFMVLFAGGGAAAFYDHRANLGGACAAMVGLLLMWVSENDRAKIRGRVAKNPFVRADWAAEA